MTVRIRLVVMGFVVLLAAACTSSSHNPPTQTRLPRSFDPTLEQAYRTFEDPAPLTLHQLQALSRVQEAVFDEYRLQYGDSFTISMRDRPDMSAEVTVLNDGTIYVGFLGRSLHVRQRTFEELIKLLIYGDPPKRPCPNCGYHYSTSAELCPACSADPYDVEGTAKVLIDAKALALFEQLGGLVHHDDTPLRRVRNSTVWIAICAQGLVGFREVDDGARTEILWSREMRRPVVSRIQALSRGGLARSPWHVRLGRGWVELDLRTGEIRENDDDDADEPERQLVPYTFREHARATGLIHQFRRPRVTITQFVPGPESYTVNVVGALNNPGRVPIQLGARLWDAIAAAGGPATRLNIFDSGSTVTPRQLPTVDWRRAVLMRQARYLPEEARPPGVRDSDLVPLRVDFEALARGDALQNVPLFPGDTIYVPEYIVAQTRVVVAGRVEFPNLYYFDGDVDVVSALARAGWFNQNISRGRKVTLVRNSFGRSGERGVYHIDAIGVATGRVRNVLLESGDILYVDTQFITDAAEFLSLFNFIIPGIPLDIEATYEAFQTLTD